jgi:hypothetical protein
MIQMNGAKFQTVLQPFDVKGLTGEKLLASSASSSNGSIVTHIFVSVTIITHVVRNGSR